MALAFFGLFGFIFLITQYFQVPVREVGGTLGVAVVGSVMSTLYGPHLVDALRSLGVPTAAANTAAESVMSGMGVATSLPADAVGPAVAAVRGAFMDGLAAGSYVAAAACALAALAALTFLPAREHTAAGVDEPNRALPAEPALASAD